MNSQIEKLEALTQQAVREVFQSMVSLDVTPEPPAPVVNDTVDQIIGSVGFIGDATGVIHLHSEVSFAKVITSRMLGLSEAEVDCDDMVNDAIGELSNMVVGFVKSRLCDEGKPCTLTIPSIVRGQQLTIEGSAQFTRRIVGFRNGNHHLLAELLLKEPQR